jgi:isopenicillin N synthase-like dioxygenase
VRFSQLDTAEFLNISKDDALAFPMVMYRTYPTQTMAEMGTVVRPFVRKSVEVNNTIIRIFNAKLGLPEGTLEQLHLDEEHSTSGVRVCRVPPMAGKAFADRPMLGSHTDFGSLVSRNCLRGLCQ